eukprot:gene12926-15183_t
MGQNTSVAQVYRQQPRTSKGSRKPLSPSEVNRERILDLITRGYFDQDENVDRFWSQYINTAATYGHLHIVEQLLAKNSYQWDGTALFYASYGGHLDIVKLLDRHEKTRVGPVHSSHNPMDAAASRGYLKIVEYLHFNRNDGCTVQAMNEASKLGHIDVLKFLNAHRHEGCTDVAV